MWQTVLSVLLISVTSTAVLVVRELRRRHRLDGDLIARGIAIDRNPSVLLVAPRRYPGSRTPQWSALVPGRQLVQLYGYGSVVVAAWRSSVQREGTVVIGSEAPMPDELRRVPSKNLPVKSVDVYSNNPSLTRWIVASTVLAVFEERRAQRRGFRFDYVDGACYLCPGTDGGFSGLDDVTETIAQLERAMIDWRLTRVA